ncbi:Hpt domain-containing protein [Pseudodesulfovibrio sp.]|uniref:Hpt domain-containing protein n=1 Tax=Pseudodesulfovibrio sp. TaxID=2035812 RepID=UPI0026190B46|nr:Hpt domain-containing protein [Pseudodesulfovibrio sp.]MDD3311814.1 Hpt domain-containing protein [Pseudodesulfovibrio sp.]
MATGQIIERIDHDLEPLMPRFFDNSRQDVRTMRDALAGGDMESLARLGHTAKGTGYGYGMRTMGDIGAELEAAAKVADAAGCLDAIERMDRYLDTVVVEFRN